MEKRIVTLRGGKTRTERRVHLSLDEAASRAAIWLGLADGKKITGRVEIKPRGKNSPLRTLVMTREGEEIGRIGVTKFSKYFVYSERGSEKKYYVPIQLDESGVSLWEPDGADNWWALANVFYI